MFVEGLPRGIPTARPRQIAFPIDPLLSKLPPCDQAEYLRLANMFAFCEDIRFLEELRKAGFREAYAVCLVDDPTFCNRDGRQRRIDGIYAPFRDGKPIHGLIEKPTGDCSRVIEVEGDLEVGSWTDEHTGFVSQLRLRNATFHKL